MSHTGIGRRAAVAGGLLAGTFARRARAQPAEVQVALLAPMSGAWARQGQLMRAGAEMAVDDLNAAGGVKALAGAKLRLMVFDAGDSAEKAKDAAQRMVAGNPGLVGGTGAWLSSFTLAVTEVTERAGLPWMTESYSDAITSRGFKYVFQTAMTADNQAVATLNEVLAAGKDVGAVPTKFGILADNTASTVSFLKPVRATEVAAHGMTLVLDEIYTPPLADVTSLVQRLRSARPQLLFLGASNVGDTKLLLDKMNELGLGRGRLPSFGNGGAVVAPEMLDIVGKEELEGYMSGVANWGGKGQEALTQRFKERTKEPWFGQDSIQTYFEISLLKEAVERAGAADREKVANVLRTIDLKDGLADMVPGRRVKFDDKGRIVDANLVIVQWQNGEPVPVYPPAMATAKASWPKA